MTQDETRRVRVNAKALLGERLGQRPVRDGIEGLPDVEEGDVGGTTELDEAPRGDLEESKGLRLASLLPDERRLRDGEPASQRGAQVGRGDAVGELEEGVDDGDRSERAGSSGSSASRFGIG